MTEERHAQPTSAIVLKLSGKALEAHDALEAFFQGLARFAASESAPKIVLVHGGGVEVDALMKELGRKIERVDGLRVSPAEDMPVIAGALAGACSLALRGAAQRAGLMPLGLAATDAGIGRVVPVDPRLGRVATIEPGGAEAKAKLMGLLEAGFTPVISSIGVDAQGQLWNINADHAAVAAAALLEAPLVFLSDVPGVLDGEKRLIEKLDRKEAERLINAGVISGGMTVKVRAAFEAAEKTGSPAAAASIFDAGLADALARGKLPGTTFLV